MEELKVIEFGENITEEAKKNFLKFLEEVKKDETNCSIANHTNHSNHSNW